MKNKTDVFPGIETVSEQINLYTLLRETQKTQLQYWAVYQCIFIEGDNLNHTKKRNSGSVNENGMQEFC